MEAGNLVSNRFIYMNSNVIIAKLEMIEAGILPAMTGRELKEMFSSLSKKEEKKVKRKFRKAWRRLAKKDRSMRKTLDIGNKKPSKNLKRTRSAMVSIQFVKNVAIKSKANQHQDNQKLLS